MTPLFSMLTKFANPTHLVKFSPRLNEIKILGSQGAWNFAEYLFLPLLMLGATPIFLHSLGDVQYGQWMLLVTLGSLGGCAGMGMGSAIIREVASAFATGDRHLASTYIRVALTIVCWGALAISLLVISVFTLVGTRFFSQIGDKSQLLPLVIGSMLLIAFDQIDSVFSGALRGADRFGWAARLEMLSRAIILFGSLLIVVASRSLNALLVISIVLNFVRVLIKSLGVAKLFGLNCVLPTWDTNIASKLIKFGKWSMAQLIGAAIFSSADRLMIGSLLGPTALTNYSICLQLSQQVQSIPASLGGALFPYFVKRSYGDPAGNQHRPLIASTVILSFVAIFIALPMVFYGYPILHLWVGSDVAAQSSNLLSLLALGYVILAVPTAAHYYLYGSGMAKWVAFTNLIAALFSLLINLFLLPSFGVFGATSARFVYGAIVIFSFGWKLLR